ncbi:MAG: hypothetical protein WDW38_000330 [Sanguina aurantia]
MERQQGQPRGCSALQLLSVIMIAAACSVSDSATVWDPSSTEDWSQGASDFAATWQTTNTPDSLILACNPHNQPGDIGWKPFCQVPCVQYGVFDEPYWWDTSRSGLDSYSGGGGIPHPFCPCGVTPPVQRP